MNKESIRVSFKVNESDERREPIECNAIEIYGDKLAFSDGDGYLLREDNKIVEVKLSEILQIKSK